MLAKKFMDGLCAEQKLEFNEKVFSTLPEEMLLAVMEKMNNSHGVIELYKKLSEGKEENNDSYIEGTDEKFVEQWEALSSEVECILSEVGDEDGKYVNPYDSWSEPEFDGYSLASDLDKVFKEMLPLLQKVYELDLASREFLSDILDEASENIAAYPEWMGAEYCDFILDAHGCECVLKWNWIYRESIGSFIENNIEVFKNSQLSSSFKPSFIANVSDGNLRELHSALLEKSKTYPDVDIRNTNSFWHILFHESEKIVDPTEYLQSSANLMGQCWEYGIPVYKHYHKMEDYKNGEIYCERTIAEAFNQSLNHDLSSNVNFEEVLFAAHCKSKDERLKMIFTDWLECCRQLKLNDKYNLVNLQRQFHLTPDNWDKIKPALQLCHDQTCYGKLLKDWKRYVIIESVDYHCFSIPIGSWIGNLLGFVMDGDWSYFIEETKNWLLSPLKETPGSRHESDFTLLVLLTKDVLFTAGKLNSYPIFNNYIAAMEEDTFSYSSKSDGLNHELRLKYLKGSLVLEDAIMSAWRNNIIQFIRSPADVYKADYSSPARWLAIARELNEDAFHTIHLKWKTEHSLKRNLWGALHGYGISKEL